MAIRHLSFFAITAITAIAILAATAWMVAGTRNAGRHQLRYQALVSYQLSKMHSSTADVVFVGDSSLGNAIDAREWERLSGRRTVNLALTGVFGIAGSFEMAARAFARHRPDVLVVMQTVGVPLGPPPDPSLLATLEGEWSGIDSFPRWWRLNMNLQELQSSATFLVQSIVKVQAPTRLQDPDDTIADDYIAQGKPIRLLPTAKGYDGTIDDAQMADLERIANLCRLTGTTCYYAFGPLTEPICSRSTSLVEKITSRVREAGIAFVIAPVCIPPGELGDSPDHVLPALKVHYTRAYFAAAGAVGN